MSPFERLVADGRITPADGDLLELGAPPERPQGAPSITKVLLDMRSDERW